MKKLSIITMLMFITLCTVAQNATQARRVLDKTAALITNKRGASANFSVSGTNISGVAGTVTVKGNKFYARTGEYTVWFNGKTRWNYLKKTNEVNVSNPTDAQLVRMSPYSYITMYRNGYTLGLANLGSTYNVQLKAQNPKRTVQKIYKPSHIKILENGRWTNIKISNFRVKRVPNSVFNFNAKDFPSAEVVDLR